MSATTSFSLAARLTAAAAAYHNGASELLMTDDEYDAAVEQLRTSIAILDRQIELQKAKLTDLEKK